MRCEVSYGKESGNEALVLLGVSSTSVIHFLTAKVGELQVCKVSLGTSDEQTSQGPHEIGLDA